jgi:hypothetical protein
MGPELMRSWGLGPVCEVFGYEFGDGDEEVSYW